MRVFYWVSAVTLLNVAVASVLRFDDAQWAGFRELASTLLTSPGGREQWRRSRYSFTQGFQDFVETLQAE